MSKGDETNLDAFLRKPPKGSSRLLAYEYFIRRDPQPGKTSAPSVSKSSGDTGSQLATFLEWMQQASKDHSNLCPGRKDAWHTNNDVQ